MKKKVKPSDELSKSISELMSGDLKTENLVHELLQLGARQVIQRLAEGELDEFLGRGWYQRDESDTPVRGYRNGYSPFQVRTSLGTLAVKKPRVRGNTDEFESKLFQVVKGVEDGLLDLAREMYVRGLSTRDIEETLIDRDGKAVLSRSVTSRACEQLYEEYEQWSQRDLSEEDVVYMFADGVYESVRKYTNNQTILCCWGICSDGHKTLLGLEAVRSESSQAWEMFFDSLKERGLRQPIFINSDGGKGIIKALSRCFPFSIRGRCIAHKMRNLMNKLPRDKEIYEPIREQLRAIYYAPNLESAEGLAAAFIVKYGEQYPSMVKCFSDDLAASLNHLKLPIGHRRFIRTTNLLERSFEEQKRRTKIIPAHINEKAAMKLVFATLIRVSRKWNRVAMSEADLVLLKILRKTITKNQSVLFEDNQLSYRLAA